MKKPKIYESDYNRTVIEIHGLSCKQPVISIGVRTVKWYENMIQADYVDCPPNTIAIIHFEKLPPHIINGLKRWRLKDEIILIPDKY
jgi:hypothetical protein